MAGIWGRENEGASSIVLSGGYEDDIDDYSYILYTGHGGQDKPGGKQIKDQEFVKGNKALTINYEKQIPVELLEDIKFQMVHLRVIDMMDYIMLINMEKKEK